MPDEGRIERSEGLRTSVESEPVLVDKTKFLVFCAGFLIGVIAFTFVIGMSPHYYGEIDPSLDVGIVATHAAGQAGEKVNNDNEGSPSSGPSSAPKASNSAAAASKSAIPKADGSKLRRAYVTQASNPSTVCQSIALIQSLRDVQTASNIDIVVLYPMVNQQRPVNKTLFEPREFVSPELANALERLGAKIRFIDPLIWSKYVKVPGGPSTGWGMSLNRIHIWALTEYDKAIWIDADVLVRKNIDHLFEEPELTAAFTHSCANCRTPKSLSGGLWVTVPSMDTYNHAINLLNGPSVHTLPENDHWRLSDLQLARAMFQNFTARVQHQMTALWPSRIDAGFLPNGEPAPPPPGNKWFDLNNSYDVLVGACEVKCMKARYNGSGRYDEIFDRPDAYTIHFSCMPVCSKKPTCFREEKQDQIPCNVNSVRIDPPRPTAACILDAFDLYFAILSRALGRNTQAAYIKHRQDINAPPPHQYARRLSEPHKIGMALDDPASEEFYSQYDYLPHTEDWVLTQETVYE